MNPTTRRSIIALALWAAFAVALGQDDPRITGVTVTEIGPLTGPEAASDMRTPDICGTDIGTMAELDGRLYLAFGDTFGWSGDACTKFGPNWRSNVLAITEDLDPSDGIDLDTWLSDAGGRAIAVTEGDHQPAFTGEDGEQTRIPTAMIAIDDRLYLHYMSVHGFSNQGGVWTCNYSRFVYSDDGGDTWTESDVDVDEREGSFNMVAMAAEPSAGEHVYVMGTACGRFGGAKVARVAPDALLDVEAWEYFDGDEWTDRRDDAVEVISGSVGEGSLVWNPGIERWLYTYLDESTASLVLREATSPEGPWSEPQTLTTIREYPQLYGAFTTPSFVRDEGRSVYFVMSLFGPYNTYLMHAELEIDE